MLQITKSAGNNWTPFLKPVGPVSTARATPRASLTLRKATSQLTLAHLPNEICLVDLEWPFFIPDVAKTDSPLFHFAFHAGSFYILCQLRSNFMEARCMPHCVPRSRSTKLYSSHNSEASCQVFESQPARCWRIFGLKKLAMQIRLPNAWSAPCSRTCPKKMQMVPASYTNLCRNCWILNTPPA